MLTSQAVWLWERAKRPIPASLLLTDQGFGVKVDEEGLEFMRDWDGWEEVAEGWVKTP
jgi:hypothetical protein